MRKALFNKKLLSVVGFQIALFLFLLFLDRAVKAWAVHHLSPLDFGQNYPFGGIGLLHVSGFTLSLNLVTNTGAAWGIFANYPYVLLGIRALLIFVLLKAYVQYFSARIFCIPLLMIIAGALGNLIDVIYYGAVVDMIYVRFLGASFPVFNVADSLITCGVIYLILTMLFLKKIIRHDAWEIIAIGNEVLEGKIVNLNAQWISHELKKLGASPYRHTTVSDNKKEIAKILKEAFLRNSHVIITGGLGPTLDDLTKETVSNFLHCPLVFEEKIALDLEKRFGKNYPSIQNQSLMPKGAIYFLNPIGTAPALVIEKNEKLIILLPGVYAEMQALFTEQIIPYLLHKFSFKKKASQRIFFGPINEIEIDPFLKTLHKQYPDLEIGIYPSFGRLEVSLSLEGENGEKLKTIVEKFSKKYSEYIFSYKKNKIAEVLHEELLTTSYKIAFAESCTGGALSSEITKQAGCSHYFLGGVVSYANALKEKMLGVLPKILESQGAVSEEALTYMLDGLLKISEADFVCAISGIAGPSGGSFSKPVGSVFIGLKSKEGRQKIFKIHAPGNRQTVIEYTVQVALFYLWKFIFNKTISHEL